MPGIEQGISFGEAFKQNSLRGRSKSESHRLPPTVMRASENLLVHSSPKTKVENYVDPESQNSGSKFPLYGFDQVVPRIMFGIVNIHAEESNVPLVWR